MKLLLFLVIALTGCAKIPFHTQHSTPLYTAHQNGWSKHLFVEVELNGNGPHVFLISPSVSTSRIHPEVAKSLGLTAQKKSNEQSFVKVDIEVANQLVGDQVLSLGSEQMPNTVSAVPLAGYLGSDFLHHFVAEIDYAKQQLKLHKKDQTDVMPNNAPLKWIKTELNARQYIISLGMEIRVQLPGKKEKETIMATLSADAGGLSLPKGMLKANPKTQKASIVIGAETFDEQVTSNKKGHAVIGMDFISDKRLIIDYANKKINISAPSKKKAKPINAMRLDRMEWSLREAKDHLAQAKLQLSLEQYKPASVSLSKHLKEKPQDIEALTLYAYALDRLGDTKGRLNLSDSLSVAQLIERKMWVSVINGLWLDEQRDKAIKLAKLGVDTVPDSPQTWVAQSDILRFSGKYKESRHALHKGVTAAGDPDAFLLRRAWSAHKDRDHLAAITYLRRMNQQSGRATSAMWFFARLYGNGAHGELLRQDIMDYTAKSKKDDSSLDFLAASLMEIGEKKLAAKISGYGISNDCSPLKKQPDQINCESWFHALVGADLKRSEKRMRQVLKKHPNRFDFLDTHAVLLQALSKSEDATAQALKAAKLASSDSYMLWQYDLLRASQ